MKKETLSKNLLQIKESIESSWFERSFDFAPIAMNMLTLEGDHLYHNLTFTTIFGYNNTELKDTSVLQILADSILENQIKKLFEYKMPWDGEANIKCKSGDTIPVMLHIEPINNDEGKIAFFIAIYSRISKQKKIEEELRFQHEYLSTMHSISLGMFRRLDLSELLNAIMVRATKITKIPNGFLYLYDQNEGKLEIKAACGNLAKYKGFKISPGKGLAGKVFQTGEPMIIDEYCDWKEKLDKLPDGKVSSVVAIPLISGGKIEGVIGLNHATDGGKISSDIMTILEEFAAIAQIAIDNAKLFEGQKQELAKRIVLEKERKEMEARLLQSQKMESIGTLAGGIAHDFNNILSSIMGFTQIAMGDAPKESLLNSDLNEIYSASLRAKDLVQQILTFARQSDEKVNAIKVSIIAKEVLKFIRSSIPTTITIEQNINSVSKVMANPTQMYQVFLNLFTNASQAMEKEGGTLTLNIDDIHLKKKKNSILKGDYIKVEIKDTGMGISKKHISNIFDPYFTTKKVGEGTGLGLSVVHGAVKGMGGEIIVASTQGEGTTFTIYVPKTADADKASDLDIQNKDLPKGNKEHLLFVDDEISITHVGKRILSLLNYEVTIENSSMKAFEMFKSNPEKYKLLITDMTMPELTGQQLSQKIKKIKPDLPIILCTGFSKYITDDKLKDESIDFYCKKPLSQKDLAYVVSQALDPDIRK